MLFKDVYRNAYWKSSPCLFWLKNDCLYAVWDFQVQLLNFKNPREIIDKVFSRMKLMIIAYLENPIKNTKLKTFALIITLIILIILNIYIALFFGVNHTLLSFTCGYLSWSTNYGISNEESFHQSFLEILKRSLQNF